MTMTTPPLARHYGLDWLRIGAFAILILYHVGMVFVPWGFHAKLAREQWVTWPMLAVNAWRLTLLFVVSGYASRALLARSASTRAFLSDRWWRLALPFVFGVLVIVPPQPWVELVTQHGYRGGFLAFWGNDYFVFGNIARIVLPTWNHLWFVLYLWLYTLALGLVLLAGRAAWPQRVFDRLFGGIGVLLVPLAYAIALHAWWLPFARETHALVDDAIGHAMYLPAFLFGFGLARSEPALAAIGRWWPAALVVAFAGYAVVLAVEVTWPGDIRAPRWALTWYGVAHALQQWGAIVALIGIADRWWNRDHPARPVLTEAVFPFYLIHQTIIVVVAWLLLGAGLPLAVDFAILVVATTLGCWLFYRLGREIGWLRPMIGLRRRHRGTVA